MIGQASFRIVVLGPALAGSGYPNAANTLRLLSTQSDFVIVDKASWLDKETRLWHLTKNQGRRRLSMLWTLGCAAFSSVFRALCYKKCICYFPYPSVFSLFALSFVPRRWRPRVIADAFNLIWPSLVTDRRLARTRSIFSRLVFWIECRALHCAERVLVDTCAHEKLCRRLYGLPKVQVISLPLAMDTEWTSNALKSEQETCESSECNGAGRRLTALFIGTLIPLHGISVIADAAKQIPSAISIRILGDGQEAEKLEPYCTSLQWERAWKSPVELKHEISKADVMLGVFGGSGKASRVLPWKIYIAMSSGKAVITQSHFSVPTGIPRPPLALVDPDPRALAEALKTLTPRTIREQGRINREFFETYLSENAIVARWRKLLNEMPTTTG